MKRVFRSSESPTTKALKELGFNPRYLAIKTGTSIGHVYQVIGGFRKSKKIFAALEDIGLGEHAARLANAND